MGLPVNSRDHRGIQIRPNFGDYFVVIHVCYVTPCASTRLRLSVLTAKRTRKPNRATLTEFAQINRVQKVMGTYATSAAAH